MSRVINRILGSWLRAIIISTGEMACVWCAVVLALFCTEATRGKRRIKHTRLLFMINKLVQAKLASVLQQTCCLNLVRIDLPCILCLHCNLSDRVFLVRIYKQLSRRVIFVWSGLLTSLEGLQGERRSSSAESGGPFVMMVILATTKLKLSAGNWAMPMLPAMALH